MAGGAWRGGKAGDVVAACAGFGCRAACHGRGAGRKALTSRGGIPGRKRSPVCTAWRRWRAICSELKRRRRRGRSRVTMKSGRAAKSGGANGRPCGSRVRGRQRAAGNGRGPGAGGCRAEVGSPARWAREHAGGNGRGGARERSALVLELGEGGGCRPPGSARPVAVLRVGSP